MFVRRRPTRSLVTAAIIPVFAAVVGLGAPPTLADQTTAASLAAPRFLRPADLPPGHYEPWRGHRVTKGLPTALFCLEKALPAKGAQHRNFSSDLEATATQVIVSSQSPATAKQLAIKAADSIEKCAARVKKKDPKTKAAWRSYGTVKVEDGARIYGVYTSHPDSEHTIHLFAVGRDGRLVTVVEFGMFGDFADAPVTAFKETARIAVERLVS
jgi:hypothetical protein